MVETSEPSVVKRKKMDAEIATVLGRLLDFWWALLFGIAGLAYAVIRRDHRRLETQHHNLATDLRTKVSLDVFNATITRLERDNKERGDRFEKAADNLMQEVRRYADRTDGYQADVRAMVSNVHERVDAVRKELHADIERIRASSNAG